MKKFLSILLVLALALALVACGGTKPEETPAEPAEEDTRIRVVNIVNGTLGDKSFFDSGAEGLKWIDEQYGDQVYTEVREMTYDNTLWEATTKDIVAEGWDIVIAGTWDMKGYIEALAPQYPDTKFWFYDESFDFDANPLDNVVGVLFAQNEGSFLVGMAAAMMTKTNKVAFMGGQPNTVLNDFSVGYAEGAAYVNPEIETNITWTQSFSDAALGKDISLGLFQQDYDVVFSCCGGCGYGAYDAVIEMPENFYTIGVDGDMAAYFKSVNETAKADRMITSMQKNVNNAFLELMGQHLDGTLPYGTNLTLGLELGGVSASPSELLSAEQYAQIEQAAQDIIDGKIVVSTAFGMDEAALAKYADGTWND